MEMENLFEIVGFGIAEIGLINRTDTLVSDIAS